MSKWYYTNKNGEKVEVTGGQLKGLAKAGLITPETIVETEEGKSAPARKVKGLTFLAAAQSETAPPKPETMSPETEPGIYGLSQPEPNPFTITAPEEIKESPIAHPVTDNPCAAVPTAPLDNPFVSTPTANLFITPTLQASFTCDGNVEKFKIHFAKAKEFIAKKPIPFSAGLGVLLLLLVVGVVHIQNVQERKRQNFEDAKIRLQQNIDQKIRQKQIDANEEAKRSFEGNDPGSRYIRQKLEEQNQNLRGR